MIKQHEDIGFVIALGIRSNTIVSVITVHGWNRGVMYNPSSTQIFESGGIIIVVLGIIKYLW